VRSLSLRSEQFHRGDGVVVVDRQLHRPPGPPGLKRHPALNRFTVQHDIALALGQRPVRDIKPDPLLARGVHRQPPTAGIPRQHGAFLDRLARIRNQRADVYFGAYAQALAGWARAVGIKREGFGAGVLKMHAAHRADDLLPLSSDRRSHAMAVRAQMRAQPRHHQAEHVEHLGHRPDRAARPWYRRALPQRQSRRQVVDPVHVRSLRLGEPPSAVGAQAFQEPVHALGVQRPDGQRRLARTGHPDHGDRTPQRHIDVDVPQVVMPCPAHGNDPRQRSRHPQITSSCSRQDMAIVSRPEREPAVKRGLTGYSNGFRAEMKLPHSRISGRGGRPSGRRARFCVPQAVGGSGSRRFAAAAATGRQSWADSSSSGVLGGAVQLRRSKSGSCQEPSNAGVSGP
jgi:hypothetical protein